MNVQALYQQKRQSAADAISSAEAFDDAVLLEAAAAKIRCDEAAEKGANPKDKKDAKADAVLARK